MERQPILFELMDNQKAMFAHRQADTPDFSEQANTSTQNPAYNRRRSALGYDSSDNEEYSDGDIVNHLRGPRNGPNSSAQERDGEDYRFSKPVVKQFQFPKVGYESDSSMCSYDSEVEKSLSGAVSNDKHIRNAKSKDLSDSSRKPSATPTSVSESDRDSPMLKAGGRKKQFGGLENVLDKLRRKQGFAPHKSTVSNTQLRDDIPSRAKDNLSSLASQSDSEDSSASNFKANKRKGLARRVRNIPPAVAYSDDEEEGLCIPENSDASSVDARHTGDQAENASPADSCVSGVDNGSVQSDTSGFASGMSSTLGWSSGLVGRGKGATNTPPSQVSDDSRFDSFSQQTDTDGTQILQCRFCPFKKPMGTGCMVAIRKHEQCHFAKGTYSCHCCTFSTININTFRAHQQLHVEAGDCTAESIITNGPKRRARKQMPRASLPKGTQGISKSTQDVLRSILPPRGSGIDRIEDAESESPVVAPLSSTLDTSLPYTTEVRSANREKAAAMIDKIYSAMESTARSHSQQGYNSESRSAQDQYISDDSGYGYKNNLGSPNTWTAYNSSQSPGNVKPSIGDLRHRIHAQMYQGSGDGVDWQQDTAPAPYHGVDPVCGRGSDRGYSMPQLSPQAPANNIADISPQSKYSTHSTLSPNTLSPRTYGYIGANVPGSHFSSTSPHDSYQHHSPVSPRAYGYGGSNSHGSGSFHSTSPTPNYGMPQSGSTRGYGYLGISPQGHEHYPDQSQQPAFQNPSALSQRQYDSHRAGQANQSMSNTSPPAKFLGPPKPPVVYQDSNPFSEGYDNSSGTNRYSMQSRGSYRRDMSDARDYDHANYTGAYTSPPAAQLNRSLYEESGPPQHSRQSKSPGHVRRITHSFRGRTYQNIPTDSPRNTPSPAIYEPATTPVSSASPSSHMDDQAMDLTSQRLGRDDDDHARAGMRGIRRRKDDALDLTMKRDHMGLKFPENQSSDDDFRNDKYRSNSASSSDLALKTNSDLERRFEQYVGKGSLRMAPDDNESVTWDMSSVRASLLKKTAGADPAKKITRKYKIKGNYANQVYNCRFCPFKSGGNLSSKAVVAKHEKCHSTSRKYVCDACNYNTDCSNNIRVHIQLHPNGEATILKNGQPAVFRKRKKKASGNDIDKNQAVKSVKPVQMEEEVSVPLSKPVSPPDNANPMQNDFGGNMMGSISSQSACKSASEQADPYSPGDFEESSLTFPLEQLHRPGPKGLGKKTGMKLKTFGKSPAKPKKRVIGIKSTTRGFVKTSRKPSSRPMETLTCPHCPLTMKTNSPAAKYNMKRHQECHGLKSRFTCTKCLYSSQYMEHMKRHLRLHIDVDGEAPRVKHGKKLLRMDQSKKRRSLNAVDVDPERHAEAAPMDSDSPSKKRRSLQKSPKLPPPKSDRQLRQLEHKSYAELSELAIASDDIAEDTGDVHKHEESTSKYESTGDMEVTEVGPQDNTSRPEANEAEHIKDKELDVEKTCTETNTEAIAQGDKEDKPPEIHKSQPNQVEESKQNDKCRYCPFRTGSANSARFNMARHERAHFMRGTFMCDICNFGCFVEWRLKKHKQLHEKERLRAENTSVAEGSNCAKGEQSGDGIKTHKQIIQTMEDNQDDSHKSTPDLTEVENIDKIEDSIPPPAEAASEIVSLSSEITDKTIPGRAKPFMKIKRKKRRVKLCLVKKKKKIPRLIVPGGASELKGDAGVEAIAETEHMSEEQAKPNNEVPLCNSEKDSEPVAVIDDVASGLEADTSIKTQGVSMDDKQDVLAKDKAKNQVVREEVEPSSDKTFHVLANDKTKNLVVREEVEPSSDKTFHVESNESDDLQADAQTIINHHLTPKLPKLTKEKFKRLKGRSKFTHRKNINKIKKPIELKEKMRTKCKFCPFTISLQARPFHLRVHEQCHYNQSKFKCEDCSFTGRCLASMKKHEVVHKRGYFGLINNEVECRIELDGSVHTSTSSVNGPARIENVDELSQNQDVSDTTTSTSKPSTMKGMDETDSAQSTKSHDEDNIVSNIKDGSNTEEESKQDTVKEVKDTLSAHKETQDDIRIQASSEAKRTPNKIQFKGKRGTPRKGSPRGSPRRSLLDSVVKSVEPTKECVVELTLNDCSSPSLGLPSTMSNNVTAGNRTAEIHTQGTIKDGAESTENVTNKVTPMESPSDSGVTVQDSDINKSVTKTSEVKPVMDTPGSTSDGKYQKTPGSGAGGGKRKSVLAKSSGDELIPKPKRRKKAKIHQKINKGPPICETDTEKNDKLPEAGAKDRQEVVGGRKDDVNGTITNNIAKAPKPDSVAPASVTPPGTTTTEHAEKVTVNMVDHLYTKPQPYTPLERTLHTKPRHSKRSPKPKLKFGEEPIKTPRPGNATPTKAHMMNSAGTIGQKRPNKKGSPKSKLKPLPSASPQLIIKYRCSLCPFTCSDTTSLQQHLSQHQCDSMDPASLSTIEVKVEHAMVRPAALAGEPTANRKPTIKSLLKQRALANANRSCGPGAGNAAILKALAQPSPILSPNASPADAQRGPALMKPLAKKVKLGQAKKSPTKTNGSPSLVSPNKGATTLTDTLAALQSSVSRDKGANDSLFVVRAPKKASPNSKRMLEIPAELWKVDGQFRCQWCDFACAREHYFKIHLYCHQRKKAKHRCKRCGYGCTRPAFLDQHMRQHHLAEGGNDCTGQPKDLLMAVRERLWDRGLDERVLVQLTGPKPDIPATLLMSEPPKEVVPPSSPRDGSPRKAKGKGTKRRWNTALPAGTTLTEDVEPMLFCPFCPFHTTSAEVQAQHANKHRKIERYSCPYCTYSTRTRVYLEKHVKLHFTAPLQGVALEHLPLNLDPVDMVEQMKVKDKAVCESNATEASPAETETRKCRYCGLSLEKEKLEAHEYRHLIGCSYLRHTNGPAV